MTGCDGSHGSGCCTSSTPCGENEGDCDDDSDCFGNLKCGVDNCNNSTFSWWEDCCYDPAKGEFVFPDFSANLINIFTCSPCWNIQHKKLSKIGNHFSKIDLKIDILKKCSPKLASGPNRKSHRTAYFNEFV